MPIGTNKVSLNTQIGVDIPDSGRTHQWYWDEKSGTALEDEIGSLDGTVNGPSWVSSAGAGGYYLDFNSSNSDAVTLPSSSTSAFTHWTENGKGTFFQWVNPDSVSGQHRIWGITNDDGLIGGRFTIDSGAFSIKFFDGNGNNIINLTSGSISTSDGWVPFAFTADGSTARMFVGDSNNDLVEEGSDSISGTTAGDWSEKPQWGDDPTFNKGYDGGMDIPWFDNVAQSKSDLQSFVDDTENFY